MQHLLGFAWPKVTANKSSSTKQKLEISGKGAAQFPETFAAATCFPDWRCWDSTGVGWGGCEGCWTASVLAGSCPFQLAVLIR